MAETVSEKRWMVNEPTVVSETVDGETIVIHLESGSYYSLEGVAGVFWSLLQEDGRDEEVLAALRLRYAASDLELKTAWQDFVRNLANEDLVRGGPAEHSLNGAPMSLPTSEGPQPFVPPRIEKFEDMKEMLLLDPIHDVSVGGWPNAA